MKKHILLFPLFFFTWIIMIACIEYFEINKHWRLVPPFALGLIFEDVKNWLLKDINKK